MRTSFLLLLAMLVTGAACAEPKCPSDYILSEGRCKRCPPGSEARDDQCVGGEGGTLASPVAMGDANTASPPPAQATENEPSLISGQDSGTPPINTPGIDAQIANPEDADVSEVDGGSAVDPCSGIPQCVTCTRDSECPDPGSCRVKHCDTSKGICEPSFAPAQSACGTSKCDGAGKCVGCLNDSDCGEPGECKVRYCNPSTRVCEPKDAPSTTSCPTGHCEQGMCVQCSTAADCADQTCQSKSCTSGQCRYTNVPAGQKGTCTTGVCTASQQCRECVGDEQCAQHNGACTEGRCMNNVCQAVSKTGACGTLKMCSSMGVCQDSCGNGVTDTQAGEQCDPTGALWNDWTCNRETCQRTGLSASSATAGSSYRRLCSSNADCATNEMCILQPNITTFASQGPVCVPKCEGGLCRQVPGYTLQLGTGGSACTEQGSCIIYCQSNAQCPPGVQCFQGAFCAGPFY